MEPQLPYISFHSNHTAKCARCTNKSGTICHFHRFNFGGLGHESSGLCCELGNANYIVKDCIVHINQHTILNELGIEICVET